jgi:hypothetical protein
MRKPSPAMLVALAALFVALGGVGIAANGGNLILGQSNSATSQTSLSAPVAGGKSLQLTNNTPYFGRWDVGFLAVGASNPGAAVSHGGYVQSGMDAIVTEVDYPSQSSLTGSSNNVNLIWSDPTGQTITGIYSVIANPNSCAIHGTLTRAT